VTLGTAGIAVLVLHWMFVILPAAAETSSRLMNPATDYDLNYSKNLKDLIQTVATDTELPEEVSAAAVTATLRYLTARLPSPAVGKLHELLQTGPNELSGDAD